MSINDTVQLSVGGLVGGENHVHTLHFRYMDITSDEQDLINTWQSTCRTAYRALFETADTCVDTITAQQVCGALPLRAPVMETEVAPNRVGSKAGSGGMEPTYVASVFSVRTAFSGKSRRGRFYIGGLRQSDVAAQAPTAGYLILMEAYITALKNAFVGVGRSESEYILVVHSRKLALLGGDCQDSSTPVTTIVARPHLGTMRSRKLGHGT